MIECRNKAKHKRDEAKKLKLTGSIHDLLVGHLVQHEEETIKRLVVKKGGKL